MISDNYDSFIHLINDFLVRKRLKIMRWPQLSTWREVRNSIWIFLGENYELMTWRLTPTEVQRVLGLRIDFKAEAIATLKS
ncbi:Conserved oligomeric Golgi complex subunit 4 [Acorus gramineus]|uniref:Conserved oligomeric Golgi complex subunit 4 n=1 Tax=Acorus gramineus TaxID=55184 RepID=A0AAV9ADB1_ACOGR|nr:Conserved oligomeric Golgi complex subunit 4 [Acorus gramineus]